MARPQKFRHQREDLSDPKVAEQLGRFVIEIEDLRSQKSKIDELLAAAFNAVDDSGFEKKYVRKVIALRAKEDGVRRDEEDGLESYEFAIEKGVSLARTRRKPANDQFNPLTGEFIDDNEASDGSPSVSATLAARVAEESAVSHSEKATVATQGEATVPTSDERVSPDEGGSAAANAGGNDVDGSAPRAEQELTSKTGEGAASALPAKPTAKLRPNCLQPTMCRSGTRDHCYSCRKAMEQGAAA